MADPARNDETRPRKAAGRVLDSRWMMALAVAAVLVAITWALLDDSPIETRDAEVRHPEATATATVELLGVPDTAEVLLDGRVIRNTRFGVSPGIRHLVEVLDDEGRSWRQVFLADGSLSLVVELRTHFVEVEVSPTDRRRRTDER